MSIQYKKYIPKHLRDNPEITGLGDWVEKKIIQPLHIDTAVKIITDFAGIEDCGCNKRKEALNNLVPFNNEKETKE